MSPQAQTGFAGATYDPAVALDFFKLAGKPATIAEGEPHSCTPRLHASRTARLRYLTARLTS